MLTLPNYLLTAEGVAEFEGIHEKLSSASTPSQSAKYEAELKTSIKRLQRHRWVDKKLK